MFIIRRLLIVFAFLVVSIMPAGLMSAAPQSSSASTNANTYHVERTYYYTSDRTGEIAGTFIQWCNRTWRYLGTVTPYYTEYREGCTPSGEW